MKMDWKISLDRYLTTPPNDDFDGWCEDVVGVQIDDSFYNENESWIEQYNGKCNEWLNKLFINGADTHKASQIIMRAFNIYYNPNKDTK